MISQISKFATFFLFFLVGQAAMAQVRPGTPIRLMILRDLDSGGSMRDEVVPMVVSGDVYSDGRVVIPDGTMAFAKVCAVRREGALSAPLYNRPARLSIEFQHLRDAEGNVVRLYPTAGNSTDTVFEITREVTKASPTKEDRDAYQFIFDNPQGKSVMAKIHKLFSDEKATFTEKEATTLIKHNVPLPFVQQAISNGLFSQTIGFIKDLRAGRPIQALMSLTPATRTAMIALRAVRDLGKLNAKVSHYIDGRFSGRNIHCPAGTEITVYSG